MRSCSEVNGKILPVVESEKKTTDFPNEKPVNVVDSDFLMRDLQEFGQ